MKLFAIILKLIHKVYSSTKKPSSSSLIINHDLSEHSFVILITSYNNEKYCKKNLESVLHQCYSNFRTIYIEDCSSDNTYKLVKKYLEVHDSKKRFTLIKNKERKLKLANLYDAIHKLPADEIVIELDGDDYLSHQNVLKIINQYYHEHDAQIVHTNYKNYPQDLAQKLKLQTFSHETPYFIKKLKLFRKYPWIYSGLRTYYAGLFQKIKREDLICQVAPFKGKFFPVSHDLAMMYPMLEMAHGKIAYIPDKLLIRNINSSVNDFKIYSHEIRQKINKQITG